MAVPIVGQISPGAGPAGGRDLVRIVGSELAPRIEVEFGDARADVLWTRDDGASSLAYVRTPPHAPGTAGITLRNLDATGVPVPGEVTVLAEAYRFLRAPLLRESNLTRLVRTLLQELKRQLLENVSIAVSVDYDDTPDDGLDLVAIGRFPSLVVTGPRIRENRLLSTNEMAEETVMGTTGPEFRSRRSPYTVDLEFRLTGASDRTVELLNLIEGVNVFLNRNRWLEMARDPDRPEVGTVRWEMDPEGELRTVLDDKAGVRAFTGGLVIRGFDVDEGQLLEPGRAVERTDLSASSLVATGGERP